MDLTNELLHSYASGQLEMRRIGESYDYRAQVIGLEKIDDKIVIRLEWWASLTDKGWVLYDFEMSFDISTEIYRAAIIGGNRLLLFSETTQELAILHQEGGSRLDPRRARELSPN